MNQLLTFGVAVAIALGEGGVVYTSEPAAPTTDQTMAALQESPEVSETAFSSDVRPGAVAADGVVLEKQGVKVGLPEAASLGEKGDSGGVAVYRSSRRPFAVAANPTEDGVQFVTVLAGRQAPTQYAYGMSGEHDIDVMLREDGGVDVKIAGTAVLLASIEAPWAHDAAGASVRTWYEVDGTTLIQNVDHRSQKVQYPVTADPKYKLCDLGTAMCMKLSRSETLQRAETFSVGLGAATASLCGVIPWSPWYAGAAKVVCAGAVATYFYSLRGTFLKARTSGRCVEVKFRIVGPAIVTAKQVSC